jgi:hypothetical protein
MQQAEIRTPDTQQIQEEIETAIPGTETTNVTASAIETVIVSTETVIDDSMTTTIASQTTEILGIETHAIYEIRGTHTIETGKGTTETPEI